MTIDLYYSKLSPSSNSVVVLINHLNVAGQFNLVEVDINPSGNSSQELLKYNPKYTVPTLVEDNGALVIWDSHVILQYVANRFAAGNSLYPSDAKARALVDRFLFYDGTSFHPTVQQVYKAKWGQKAEPSEEVLNELQRKLQNLDKILGNQQFIAGNSVSIADISLSTNLPVLIYYYPNYVSNNLSQWYDRVKAAVPALQQAFENFKEAIKAALK